MGKIVIELPAHLHEGLRQYLGRLQARASHRVTLTQVVGNLIEKAIATDGAAPAGALSNVGTDATADAMPSAAPEAIAQTPPEPPKVLRGAVFDV